MSSYPRSPSGNIPQYPGNPSGPSQGHAPPVKVPVRSTQPLAAPNMGTNLQPSFAHEIPLGHADHQIYEGMLNCIGCVVGNLGAIPCYCCFPNPFATVPQGSVGLITKFGKYYRCTDPGLYQINVMTEKLSCVDIKMQVEDIPRQFIMTKDNCNVSIDSVLYWHVIDPYTATYMVSNVRVALRERTQTTLRHILGTRTLQDCIENRETIANHIQEIIAEPAKAWGVQIESILIKDLQFSPELQESLAAAAKQKRIAESKVIAAQGEVDAAKLMREAADILNTPAAMQIRYLETLQNMASSSGAKVIFMPGSASSVEGNIVASSTRKDKGKDPMQAMMDHANLEILSNLK